MKKMNRNAMRFSAVFATALMAASAAGMTVSASKADVIEAVNNGNIKSISHSKKTAYSVAPGEASISLVGKSAKPGDLVEVDLIFDAKNECTCYDVLIEFDARLELEDVEGTNASCEFEDSGRKFVSLVGYKSVGAYADGIAIATMKFRVPKNAENDDYEVKFSEVKSFSDDEGDFEDARINNAVITVTGGVAKKETGVELVSVTGAAGGNAVVQVVPTTGNRCVAYDMLVEYDSRLLLEDNDVAGANSFDIFEQDGRSYVALVGYTKDVYADGEAMAALNFHLPYDAKAADTYEVKFAQVKSFSTSTSDLENYKASDAVISVMEAKDVKDVKTFQKFAVNGMIIASRAGLRGDANGDGKVNVRDAAAIAQVLAGKGRSMADEMFEFFGDVDDNGKLNVRDAAKIAKYVANGSVKW